MSGNFGKAQGGVDLDSRSPKDAVRLLATGNIALTGLIAVDGVTAVAGDRIAAFLQSVGSQTGIYIAAAGPTASRLAGRVGDGFICTSGKAPELYRETLLPNVQLGLEKAGREMDDIEKTIEMKVSFDTDIDRAKQDTTHWAALALSAEEKTGVEDPLEMEKLADALPVERAASRWIVSDDPDEHIEQIAPYIELGFSHLVFHAPGPDQERFMRLYAKEVLPKIRKKFD